MSEQATERVTVFTRDGRPVYNGVARLPQEKGGYEVTNDETGETVRVPAAFIGPEGSHDDCDCPGCMALWDGSKL